MSVKSTIQKKPIGAAVLDRVSVLSSAIRKASFMGAAATALVAGSPLLYSRALAAEITTIAAPQAPVTAATAGQVQDLLSVPMQTTFAPAVIPLFEQIETGVTPIDHTNSGALNEDVTLTGEQGNVTFNNTGDISGGIDITTGQFKKEDATKTYEYSGSAQTVETIYKTYSFKQSSALEEYYANGEGTFSFGTVVKTNVTTNGTINIFDGDSNAAEIRITNTGSVTFTGERGINAKNESGTLIDIYNSGDIVSAGQDGAVGIQADTSNQALNFNPGAYELISSVAPIYDYTYYRGWNGGAFKTKYGVIQTGEKVIEKNIEGFSHDTGDVIIGNGGTIDVGRNAINSAGIVTVAPGMTLVSNSGSIVVGHGTLAGGIQSFVEGETAVYNSGSINFGNRGTGIDVRADFGVSANAGLNDFNAGNILVVNSGDINGGVTRDEFLTKDQSYIDYHSYVSWDGKTSTFIGGTGMFAAGVGVDTKSQQKGAALKGVNWIEGSYERYGLDLPTEGVVYDTLQLLRQQAGDVQVFSTTVINEGSITLGDGASGVKGATDFGFLNLINQGSITVGNGSTNTETEQFSRFSSGMSSHTHPGNPASIYADIYMLNDEGGIISTGDDGIGMAGYVLSGRLDMVNKGDINVGSGLLWEQTYDGWNGSYIETFMAPSYGMRAKQYAYSSEKTQTMTAYNAGSITTGDFSQGINVSRYNRTFDYYVAEADANAINVGSITTGDNSSGMVITSISNGFMVNTGDITIGSLNADLFTEISDYAFPNEGVLNQGMRVRSQYTNYITNNGSVTTGNNTAGIYSRVNRVEGYTSIVALGENSRVTSGNESTGILMTGGGYASLENAGTVTVGDNAAAVDTRFFGFADHQTYWDALTTGAGGAQVINTGDIIAGNNSTGVNMTGAYYQGFACSYDPYGWSSCDESQFQNTQLLGQSYLVNAGNIRVGDNSTAVQISGVGRQVNGVVMPQLINYGTISAGENGVAVKVNTADLLVQSGDKVVPGFVNGGGAWLSDGGFGRGDYTPYVPYTPYGGGGIYGGISATSINNGALAQAAVQPRALPLDATPAIDSTVVNYGTIEGDILFGAGNDVFINGASGNIVMNDTVVDMGTGNNVIYNEGGTITVESGDNLITGAPVVMYGGTINAINGMANSTLTIDSNVYGNFAFAADITNTAADQLIINGDVGAGSSIGIILSPAEQMKGAVSLDLLSIAGSNGAGDAELLGVSGAFADTLLDASISTDANGVVSATAVFGMGHASTVTTAATSMLQNWWMQSMSSFEKRNSHWLGGAREDGISVWGSAWHDEGSVTPDNALQDTDFDQLISATQLGLTYTMSLGDTRLAVGPSFSMGQGRASLNANTATTTADATSYGLNASLTFANGLYLDAAWQRANMDFDLKTPDAAVPTRASTEGSGDGFNVEAGYKYAFESGLSLLPQVQYASVDADVDDFTTDNGLYEHTDVGGKASRLRAGVSLFKSFTTQNGTITPLVNVSYLDMMDGDSQLKANGVDFGTDTSGSGYSLELGVSGTYHNWDIGVRMGASETSATDMNLSTNVNVRYHW